MSFDLIYHNRIVSARALPTKNPAEFLRRPAIWGEVRPWKIGVVARGRFLGHPLIWGEFLPWKIRILARGGAKK